MRETRNEMTKNYKIIKAPVQNHGHVIRGSSLNAIFTEKGYLVECLAALASNLWSLGSGSWAFYCRPAGWSEFEWLIEKSIFYDD